MKLPRRYCPASTPDRVTNDTYSYHEGSTPLLVSVPHDGRKLPDDVAENITDAAGSLPDTDWHVARLYNFVQALGASMLVANYSRYVVDLNRPADDAALYEGQLATGLCPTQTFAGDDIYAGPLVVDKDARVRTYWQPYHARIEATLNELRDAHGYALLWDAHSIPSRVPTLFTGELPVLNVGTWEGRSCEQMLEDAIMRVATDSPYGAVLNARFKGGFITRHYGRPADGVHAVQLELAQRAYMDEASTRYDDELASQICDTLERLLAAFLKTAADNAVILSR